MSVYDRSWRKRERIASVSIYVGLVVLSVLMATFS